MAGWVQVGAHDMAKWLCFWCAEEGGSFEEVWIVKEKKEKNITSRSGYLRSV
jgi:hypothetical protein